MLRKICVIYRRGEVTAAAKILAPDEEAARRLFFSNRHGYGGCGTVILKVEDYDRRQHEMLVERGKAQRIT